MWWRLAGERMHRVHPGASAPQAVALTVSWGCASLSEVTVSAGVGHARRRWRSAPGPGSPGSPSDRGSERPVQVVWVWQWEKAPCRPDLCAAVGWDAAPGAAVRLGGKEHLAGRKDTTSPSRRNLDSPLLNVSEHSQILCLLVH